MTPDKSEVLYVRSFMWLDDVARDVRHALRTLRRSPAFTTAAAATTQPTKKPIMRWRAPVSRLLSASMSGRVRELKSTSPSTAFVRLPVMTAVEGATGRVKRKRAN